MAGLDITSSSSKRASNHELPLVPFIDFLLCLVMFLLVTAAWSHMARLEANASVPGSGERTAPHDRELHVSVRDQVFELTWREGQTVLASATVPRRPVELDGSITYPDLIQALQRELQMHRPSTSGTSLGRRAILHAGNEESFAELSAILDALHAPTRDLTTDTTTKLPAFRVAFATD